LAARNSRAIHQYVYRPKLLRDRLDNAVDQLGIVDIEGLSGRFDAISPSDLAGGCPASFQVACSQYNVGSRRGVGLGHGEADASITTGYECYFAVERKKLL